MAAVAAQRHVAARQRVGCILGLRGDGACARDQYAVIAAAAHLQGLAVPVGGEVDLEFDGRRGGVHQGDAAVDGAIFAVGGVGGDELRGNHRGAGGGEGDGGGGIWRPVSWVQEGRGSTEALGEGGVMQAVRRDAVTVALHMAVQRENKGGTFIVYSR